MKVKVYVNDFEVVSSSKTKLKKSIIVDVPLEKKQVFSDACGILMRVGVCNRETNSDESANITPFTVYYPPASIEKIQEIV